jgi:hypothetical protein
MDSFDIKVKRSFINPPVAILGGFFNQREKYTLPLQTVGVAEAASHIEKKCS